MSLFSSDPDIISWGYLLQFIVFAPLAVLALRLPGQRWYEALDLQCVPLKIIVRWTVIWLVCWLSAIFLYWRMALPVPPLFQVISTTRHAGLLLTSVMLAPVLEEIIFRAAGFRLLRHTRAGLYGTLLITSMLFMLIHVQQYNGALLILMFCFGVLLGLAREKTGSLLVPLILHALNNLCSAAAIMGLNMSVAA